MEKRTTNRSPYKVQVTIRIEERCLVGKTHDISAGGMFIISDERPIVGKKITLTFDLPNIPQATLDAFVRWYTDSGFGVQFAPIGARETHAINRICSNK